MVGDSGPVTQWAPLPDGLLPCLGCGYDLRGSPPQGTCPECGRPYFREEHSLDIARQRLREVMLDASFVSTAGTVVAPALLAIGAVSILSPPLTGSSQGLFLLLLGTMIGFFYTILVVLYVYCWAQLLIARLQRRVLWAHVRGVGLSRLLLKAGFLLLLPILELPLL